MGPDITEPAHTCISVLREQRQKASLGCLAELFLKQINVNHKTHNKTLRIINTGHKTPAVKYVSLKKILYFKIMFHEDF